MSKTNGETPKEPETTEQLLLRFDNWENDATGLGNIKKDHRMHARFKQGRIISREEYDAMYIEEPLFAKVVDSVAEHGTRKWIKVTAQDGETEGEDDETEPEELPDEPPEAEIRADGGFGVDSNFSQDVLDALETLDAQENIFELWRLARLDGGAAMMIGADDGLPPEMPLNLKRVTGLKTLNVVTRHEIFPVDVNEDIRSEFFREPEFYMFTGRAAVNQRDVKAVTRQFAVTDPKLSKNLEELGSLRIHRSRIIRMRGIRIAESLGRFQQSSASTSGGNSEVWGTPIIQRLYDDLRQYNAVFAHTEAGFKDLHQGVLGIKDLLQILGSPDGKANLMKRMAIIGMSAGSFNTIIHDAELEKYEKRGTQFGSVDKVILRFMEKLASAAEIPLTKLFGMAPSGLSTDDESAEKTFNASIANKQKLKLKKPLNRIVEVLLHAKEGPTDGVVPESWKVHFIPLDEPNEKEQADTEQTRAETDKIHLDNGTLDPVEVRSRLKNDPDLIYSLNSERDAAMEEDNDPAEELKRKREMQEMSVIGMQAAAAAAPGKSGDDDDDDEGSDVGAPI